jgi:hypothetical protein
MSARRGVPSVVALSVGGGGGLPSLVALDPISNPFRWKTKKTTKMTTTTTKKDSPSTELSTFIQVQTAILDLFDSKKREQVLVPINDWFKGFWDCTKPPGKFPSVTMLDIEPNGVPNTIRIILTVKNLCVLKNLPTQNNISGMRAVLIGVAALCAGGNITHTLRTLVSAARRRLPSLSRQPIEAMTVEEMEKTVAAAAKLSPEHNPNWTDDWTIDVVLKISPIDGNLMIDLAATDVPRARKKNMHNPEQLWLKFILGTVRSLKLLPYVIDVNALFVDKQKACSIK